MVVLLWWDYLWQSSKEVSFNIFINRFKKKKLKWYQFDMVGVRSLTANRCEPKYLRTKKCMSVLRGVPASWKRMTLKSLWWQEITTWTQISSACCNTQGQYHSPMHGSNNQKEENSIYFVSAHRSQLWSTVLSFDIHVNKYDLGKGGDLRRSTKITRKCYLSNKRQKETWLWWWN